jgi:two-component system, chemotaxis family, chemotaxis protein CheY
MSMAKILIVDHCNGVRRTLKHILRVREHTLLEAADEAAAIERYFLERPQLVLLDANLDDLLMLRTIRAIDPVACVLVMTANIHHSTRALARVGGAFGFIVKPFVAEQVVSMVDAALQNAPAWRSV